MEARAHVISREIIKPSYISQTPNHLKKMKLSILDQLIPPCYVPLIFFYLPNESKGLTISNHAQISQQLKHSLSHTLPSFYPLAGRLIKDEFVVDCNDEGVEFINARIHARFIDTTKDDPNVEDLKQYLPINPTSTGCPDKGPLFLAQVTFFDCGGIAIAICFAHQIADCESMTAFLNAWASTSRGEGFEVPRHFNFDLANYFPARDLSGFPNFRDFTAPSNYEDFKTKRIVFDEEKLTVLKRTASSSSSLTGILHPSRVELVSAFIWKHFIGSSKLYNPEQKEATFVATHAVNLRSRTRHLLENVFGNCFTLALATFNTNKLASNNQHEEFHDLVSKLRSSIRIIDEDYIRELAQGGDNYLEDLCRLFSPISGGEQTVSYFFSSWCRFPLYEVDYGWGNPFLLCANVALPINNVAILVSSKSGESIEAWVNMKPESLEILETQIKLISTNE